MIKTVTEECSEFLHESHKHPMLKNLSRSLDDFCKVKVRKQKKTTEIDKIFNNTFDYYLLKQRCVISYTENTLPKPTQDQEPFFIFPINGYRVLHSKIVAENERPYGEVLDSLQKEIGMNSSKEILSDVMKFNYSDDNLHKALRKDCEIIIYNIPFYYAIRKSSINNYKKLFKS